jgi:hypothetical protein
MQPSNSTMVLLSSKTLNTILVFPPHARSSHFIYSTITRAVDGYCPKVFTLKEDKKWRGIIMVLRNIVDKGTA